MSQIEINMLSQKLYINGKKYAEIASRANGKHKSALEYRAKKLLKRSNTVASGKL